MTTVSASYELQKAVTALLVANAEIQALLKEGTKEVRVYDDVPESAVTPYVIIGDDEESNIGGECLPGSTHTIALTVVSANVGFKLCKLVAAALCDALDGADVQISGFEKNSLFLRAISHRRHPDQATLRQSTVIFEIELRPDH